MFKAVVQCRNTLCGKWYTSSFSWCAKLVHLDLSDAWVNAPPICRWLTLYDTRSIWHSNHLLWHPNIMLDRGLRGRHTILVNGNCVNLGNGKTELLIIKTREELCNIGYINQGQWSADLSKSWPTKVSYFILHDIMMRTLLNSGEVTSSAYIQLER